MMHALHGDFYLENVVFNEPYRKSLLGIILENAASLFKRFWGQYF